MSNRITLSALSFETLLQELDPCGDDAMYRLSESEFATKGELKVLAHRYLCLIYFYGLNGLVDYTQALHHGEEAARRHDGVAAILTAAMYLRSSMEDPHRVEEGRDLIHFAMREGNYTSLLNSLSKHVPLLREVVEQIGVSE